MRGIETAMKNKITNVSVNASNFDGFKRDGNFSTSKELQNMIDFAIKGGLKVRGTVNSCLNHPWGSDKFVGPS